ncbi:hypothetical protein KEM55_009245, partial [Ascosphaera atra]
MSSDSVERLSKKECKVLCKQQRKEEKCHARHERRKHEEQEHEEQEHEEQERQEQERQEQERQEQECEEQEQQERQPCASSSSSETRISRIDSSADCFVGYDEDEHQHQPHNDDEQKKLAPPVTPKKQTGSIIDPTSTNRSLRAVAVDSSTMPTFNALRSERRQGLRPIGRKNYATDDPNLPHQVDVTMLDGGNTSTSAIEAFQTVGVVGAIVGTRTLSTAAATWRDSQKTTRDHTQYSAIVVQAAAVPADEACNLCSSN